MIHITISTDENDINAQELCFSGKFSDIKDVYKFLDRVKIVCESQEKQNTIGFTKGQ